MDVQQKVRSHYSREDLAAVVLRAVADAGADLDHLRPDDLGSVDQLHLGGATGTAHLLDRLALDPTTALLDVGGGLGGPARMAASRWGCFVVSVDLSPDFVAAAQVLTERVGLADRVEHRLGPAERTGLARGRFSRAMMLHVGMNLPDPAAVFAEVRRLLPVGGLFGLWEQVRVGDGPLDYPLPWAEDASSSFLRDLDGLTGALEASGFAVEEVEDRTAAVTEGGPGAGAPLLSPATVFGPGFVERLRNDVAAVRAGVLAPVVVVARAV